MFIIVIDQKQIPDQRPQSPTVVYEKIDPAEREAYLRDKLGTDYDFAQEQGLLDMFYVNPETGKDGLMHVLTGVTKINDHGGRIPEGFHHESSSISPATHVDSEHLEDANLKKRKSYRQNRYEPYSAKVVIDGFEKLSRSVMFPKEYDVLTTLRAIEEAYQTRDTTKDIQNERGNIVAEGQATLLDGISKMDIKLILDPETKKIITAFPFKLKKNIMSLGRRAVNGRDTAKKDQEKIDELLGLK